MPDISLDLRRIAYPSDQNAAVSAWRAYTEALLASLVRFSCLSGSAGLGTLPFSSCLVVLSGIGPSLSVLAYEDVPRPFDRKPQLLR
jgi:hypothetical protein